MPLPEHRNLLTVSDLLALPEQQRRHEVLDGELVEKASPSFEHGLAQTNLATYVNLFFGHPGGGGGGGLPGGWWFVTEVEIELSRHVIVRPDLAGWRRDRVSARPGGVPITVRPDWICEVLSPANASTDTVRKLNQYYRHGLPHYWLLDPRAVSAGLSVIHSTATW